MKIRKDEQGVLYIQINPNERYCLLFHRLNKGTYEQYVVRKHKEYILNTDELKQVQDYIQKTEVRKYDNSTSRSTKAIQTKAS